MKRTLLRAAVVIPCAFVLLFLSACQGQSVNRAATENANTHKEPVVDIPAIEKELLQLERDWAAAAVNHNADAVRRVEADDILITYIDGTTGTKTDDVRDIESGALSADAWDIADVKVKVLDQDAAIVTGRGIIKNGKYKGSDGKTQTLKPEYRFTDVFARRNGQWQVVASQTTTIANPSPTPIAKTETTPSAAATTSASPTAAKSPSK